MPTEDGYPTDEELKVFDRWKISKDTDSAAFIKGFHPQDVVEHLESIWWYPERQIELREGRDHLFRRKVMKLALHTGGWSGNEDIIRELEQTWFWFMYWCQSHRGGHYYFEIRWNEWVKERTAQND